MKIDNRVFGILVVAFLATFVAAVASNTIELSSGNGEIIAPANLTFDIGEELRAQTSGDGDDYIQFSTVGNTPTIDVVGGAYLSIHNDVNISNGQLRITADGIKTFRLYETGGDVLMQVIGDSTLYTSENFVPDQDDTYTLGATAGGNKRWADVKSVLINGADFCFENNICLTECNVDGKKDICFVNGKPTVNQRKKMALAAFFDFDDYRSSHMIDNVEIVDDPLTNSTTEIITKVYDDSLTEEQFNTYKSQLYVDGILDFTFTRTVHGSLRELNGLIARVEALEDAVL
jgi:hypothetical protein